MTNHYNYYLSNSEENNHQMLKTFNMTMMMSLHSDDNMF